VNIPGVLGRVSQVFARQAFNVHSVVASPGVDGKFTRMTITCQGDPQNLDQIIKQLNNLVDVVHCEEHSEKDSVVKELALIKIKAGIDKRTEILQIAEHFGCKTQDLTEKSMIIMATGDSGKLDALVNLMKSYEIIEMVRTGNVVMARGDKPT